MFSPRELLQWHTANTEAPSGAGFGITAPYLWCCTRSPQLEANSDCVSSTNRAPVFNAKGVLCDLSNLPHQRKAERSQGRVWTVEQPHWTSTQAPLLSTHFPASNTGYKGFLFRVVYKLSNLDTEQPPCPKGDGEQKFHQNLLLFLCH